MCELHSNSEVFKVAMFLIGCIKNFAAKLSLPDLHLTEVGTHI